MNAVLDANVLIADYQLRGASLRLLLLMVRRGNLKMTVPALALREVVGKYKATLQEQQKKLEPIRKELSRLNEDYAGELPVIDASQEAADYDKWLRDQLSDDGVKIAPIPEISHERLTERAVNRIKPFRDTNNGVTGYRDSLIWFTVLNQAETDNVAFVSKNHKDFQEESGGRLHVHLRDDLQAQSLTEEQLTVFNSIDEFRKNYVSPDPGLLQNIQQLLRDDRDVQRAFENSARGAIAEWLKTRQLGAKPLIPVIGVKDIDVDLQVKAKAISEAKVYKSEGSTVIVDLLVSGTGKVSYEYPREYTATFVRGGPPQVVTFVKPDEPQLPVQDFEGEEVEPVTADTRSEKLQFSAALTISFDRDTNEILRADVLEIKAE